LNEKLKFRISLIICRFFIFRKTYIAVDILLPLFFRRLWGEAPSVLSLSGGPGDGCSIKWLPQVLLSATAGKKLFSPPVDAIFKKQGDAKTYNSSNTCECHSFKNISGGNIVQQYDKDTACGT